MPRSQRIWHFCLGANLPNLQCQFSPNSARRHQHPDGRLAMHKMRPASRRRRNWEDGTKELKREWLSEALSALVEIEPFLFGRNKLGFSQFSSFQLQEAHWMIKLNSCQSAKDYQNLLTAHKKGPKVCEDFLIIFLWLIWQLFCSSTIDTSSWCWPEDLSIL